jgi:threonine dehydratase
MNTLAKIESALPLPVTVDDILAARTRIAGAIVKTPTLISQTFSDMLGCNVYLKFENLQFTAAYKERGALNRLLQLDDESKAKGVIAASAGNHAQGLAYHGKRLGVPVTIVMPTTTPIVKVTQTRGHGATVVQHGEKFDDAYAHARKLEVEQGLTFVHPFDEPDIIAGQGTRNRHAGHPDRRRRPLFWHGDRRAGDEAGHQAGRCPGRTLPVHV